MIHIDVAEKLYVCALLLFVFVVPERELTSILAFDYQIHRGPANSVHVLVSGKHRV